MSINSPSLPSEHHSDLIVQFLADLMRATLDHHDHAASHHALQSYCDHLRPWLAPSDGPPNPRTLFSLVESCAFDESGEHSTVVLTPEAEALFRAWLRRNQIASVAGLNTAHVWSN